MNIHFYKFHGNGNDFIIIDNRTNTITLNTLQIKTLCKRRFGLGADGLMILANSEKYDFEMRYYNSDGNLGSMCGNGGRCIAAFANMIGLVGNNMKFTAFDGVHEAVIKAVNIPFVEWDVKLQLANVSDVNRNKNSFFLDTGSPHYVEFVDNVSDINVNVDGKKIRNSNQFKPNGTNVNFVELSNDKIFVRTFERGVEQETFSCGTGVTASAIATYLHYDKKPTKIHTKGGDFKISFNHENNEFTNVWIQGAARFVFEGEAFVKNVVKF